VHFSYFEKYGAPATFAGVGVLIAVRGQTVPEQPA
jgi:hypothetical protein